MTIEETVITNPAVVIAFIGSLVFALSKLVTQPYKQLSKAIDTLTKAVGAVQAEIKLSRQEAKTDREHDKAEVGTLMDRMQAQETKCLIVRQYCPHAGPVTLSQVEKAKAGD